MTNSEKMTPLCERKNFLAFLSKKVARSRFYWSLNGNWQRPEISWVVTTRRWTTRRCRRWRWSTGRSRTRCRPEPPWLPDLPPDVEGSRRRWFRRFRRRRRQRRSLTKRWRHRSEEDQFTSVIGKYYSKDLIWWWRPEQVWKGCRLGRQLCLAPVKAEVSNYTSLQK